MAGQRGSSPGWRQAVSRSQSWDPQSLDLQSLLPPQFFFPHSFSSPLFFQLLPLLLANDVSVRFPSASNSASLYPFPFPYLQEPLKPNPPRHHRRQSRTLGFSFCSMPHNFVYFLHFLIYLVKKARKLVCRQRLLRCVYGGFRVQAPTPPTSPPRSPRWDGARAQLLRRLVGRWFWSGWVPSLFSQWGPGLGLGNGHELDFQRWAGHLTKLERTGRPLGVTAPTLGWRECGTGPPVRTSGLPTLAPSKMKRPQDAPRSGAAWLAPSTFQSGPGS